MCVHISIYIYIYIYINKQHEQHTLTNKTTKQGINQLIANRQEAVSRCTNDMYTNNTQHQLDIQRLLHLHIRSHKQTIRKHT